MAERVYRKKANVTMGVTPPAEGAPLPAAPQSNSLSVPTIGGQTTQRVYKKKAATPTLSGAVGQTAQRTYTVRPEVKAQKLQTWFGDAMATVKETQDYVTQNEGKYSPSFGNDYVSKIGELLTAAESVRSYLDFYKRDAKTYSELTEALAGVESYLRDFDTYAASVRESHSKYADETEYLDDIAKAKQYEEDLRADTWAMKNDIQLTKDLIGLIDEYLYWGNRELRHHYGTGEHGAAEVGGKRYDLQQKMSYYGISPDDKKSLEKKLATTEQLYDRAKKAQVQDAIAKAKADPEFSATAAQGSTMKKPIYDTYDEIAAAMSQEQREMYDYLLVKFGEEDANIYFDMVRASIQQDEASAFHKKYLEDQWYEGVWSVVQGLDRTFTGLQNAFGKLDTDDRTFDPQTVGALVSEDLGEKETKLWYNFAEGKWETKILGKTGSQLGYDFTTTTSAMLPAIGVGALSNLVVPGAGAVVMPAMMGLSSSGSAYKEAIDRGYEHHQAFNYAHLVGTSEALLSMALNGIGTVGNSLMGNAVKNATAGIKSAAARFAVQLGGNMLSEAMEEGLQEILTPFFENIALDADNTWDDIDWEAAGYSALMGALSAGLFEGAVTPISSLAVKRAQQNAQYRKLGRQFLDGKNGVTIDDAIAIGLNNAKGTDAYVAAEKIQQKVKDRGSVSAYSVGRMVAESQTEQARRAKAIEAEVLETGAAVGYDAAAVDTVARAAVALNQRVRFAAEGELVNSNSAAEYHRNTDTVLLNPVLTDVNMLIGEMMAHEAAHTAEGTKQLAALAKIAQRMENHKKGADAWKNLKADVRKEYADAGQQLSDPEVQKEAVARWIGKNLFTNKAFAKAVADGDVNVGNAFFYLIDRVRRAMGAKNASAGNLAMLERLFMQALNNRTVGPKEGDVQGAIASPKQLTKTAAIQLMELCEHGELPLTSFIPVSRTTPIIVIDSVKDDVTLQKWPMAMKVSKVQQMIEEADVDDGGARLHGISPDMAAEIFQNIFDPEYVVFQKENGRVGVLAKMPRGHKGMALIVISPGRSFNVDLLNGYEGGAYNVAVTAYSLDDVNHYLKDERHVVRYDKKSKANHEEAAGSIVPSLSNDSPYSDTNIAQKIPSVKPHSMQEGAGIFTEDGGNSAQGALLPPEYRPGARAEGVDLNADVEGVTESPRLPDGQTPPFRQGGQTPSVADGDTSLREGGLQGDVAAEPVQVDEAAVLDNAIRSAAQGKVTSQATDVEGVIADLGDEEAVRRMYTAAQMHRPTGMVEVDGRRVDAGAYMDAYERSLPDDAAALEATVRELSERRTAEIVRMEQEGTLEDYRFGGLKIDLQLFAAQRKWDLLQLDAGEDGKKARQFYEKRLRGTDANHNQELVDLLAGRSETYNPIADEVTLDRAKGRLRDHKYQEKLIRRIGKYDPRDVLTAVDVAAAQVLINDAINEGELEVAADLIAGLSRKGTELGRAVQAFSMMARLTPEGTLRAAIRTVKADADYVIGEGANEGLDVLADDLVRAIRKAEEEGLSSDEIVARIRNGTDNSYGANSSADIHNMLARIRRGDFKQNDKVEFGRVPDAIAAQIKEVTGTDVTGYKMVIEARILDHILKDHGAQGRADHSMADDAAVARMGDVLANPDDIRSGDPTKAYMHQSDGKGRPAPTVIYEKGEGTKSYYVIHTVTDTNKKTLYVTTAFIGQPGYKNTGAQQTTDGKSPGATSEIGTTGTPTDSIPQEEDQVKVDVKMTREELVEALTDDLAATEGTYLTRDDVSELVEKVVNDATNIPQQLKRYVLKKIRKGDGALAQRIYEVYKKGHLNNAALRRAMEEALELPTLTDNDIEWVVKQGEKIESLKDRPVEQAAAMDELYDFLGAKLSVNGLDRLQAWRKFGMLFNVKTHFRNILSNGAYYGIRKADDAVAMLLEQILVRDPSQRSAALGWSHTEHGQSIMPMLQEQAELAVLEMQKRGAKYETGTGQLKQRRKFFGLSKFGEMLNSANRWNSEWLEREDIWFFRPAYIDALGQIMTARGATEVTPELHQLAMQRALEATFRADNMISDVISALKRFQNESTTGKRLFGHAADVVIPFHKTPANLAAQAVWHSPIGIVKGAFDLYNATRGKGSKDVATAINTMAKGVTGSVLLIIGLVLGSAGLFNTGFGKTEKERAADEMAGLQDGAFVVGGVSVSLDWLQPAASPLIVGASIAERLKSEGLTLNSITGAVMDGTDSLFELTMLQSLYDILGGYDAGASGTMMSVGENVVSQSVPTLLGQLARAIDPVQRKTKGDTEFETIINQVVAKIPGLTYLLDPELDVWGNVVYRTGQPSTGTAVLNAGQQFIIPANTKVGTGKGDPISQEILRLYKDQGGAVIPTAVTRDEAKDAGEDYVDVNKLLGGVNRLAVEAFIGNEKAYDVMVETGKLTAAGNPQKKKVTKYYRDMTDDERRLVLSGIYEDSKAEVLGKTDHIPEEHLNDSERYIRELLRRVRNGERGTFDGTSVPTSAPAQPQQEQPQQEDTSYYVDLLRRMKNGN